MPRNHLAPRLKLLGLLLMTASIIMGLILSAAGVQAVNLKGPFAKKVVREIETGWEQGTLQSFSTQAANAPAVMNNAVQPSAVNPTVMPSGYPTDVPANNATFDGSGVFPNQIYAPSMIDPSSLATGTPTSPVTTTDATVSPAENSDPMVVSIWTLLLPVMFIGMILWMTPQPSNSSASYKSR